MPGLRASVIIPSWNTRDFLADCLDSVASQELAGGFETIVVDNASTDGTAELLRERRDVTVITNSSNADFAGANNQAARQAGGRTLVFLNSDTKLLAGDALERLATAVEAPGVGVAGPLLLNPDGSVQPSCSTHPSIGRALLLASGLHRLLPDPLRARFVPHTWSHDHSRDTGWVKGAALAVPADVFSDVGGFWPTTYGEEEDLAYKVRRRGLRVRFERSARVVHVGNRANIQRWSDEERAVRIAIAEQLFLRRHYGRPRATVIRGINRASYALRAHAHRLLGHSREAGVYGALARAYATPPHE